MLIKPSTKHKDNNLYKYNPYSLRSENPDSIKRDQRAIARAEIKEKIEREIKRGERREKEYTANIKTTPRQTSAPENQVNTVETQRLINRCR